MALGVMIIDCNVVMASLTKKSTVQEETNDFGRQTICLSACVHFRPHLMAWANNPTSCFDTIQGLPLKHGIFRFKQTK